MTQESTTAYMAQWLRRWTYNTLSYASVGSKPILEQNILYVRIK